MDTLKNKTIPHRSLAERLGGGEEGADNAYKLIELLVCGYSYSEIAKRMSEVLPTRGAVARACRDWKEEIGANVAAYLVQYGPQKKRGNSCSFAEAKARIGNLRSKRARAALRPPIMSGDERIMADAMRDARPGQDPYQAAADALCARGRDDLGPTEIKNHIAEAGGLDIFLLRTVERFS